MVSLNPVLLVAVDIHKRLFTSQSAMLVELMEGSFERAEWAASFEKGKDRRGFERDIPKMCFESTSYTIVVV